MTLRMIMVPSPFDVQIEEDTTARFLELKVTASHRTMDFCHSAPDERHANTIHFVKNCAEAQLKSC